MPWGLIVICLLSMATGSNTLLFRIPREEWGLPSEGDVENCLVGEEINDVDLLASHKQSNVKLVTKTYS